MNEYEKLLEDCKIKTTRQIEVSKYLNLMIQAKQELEKYKSLDRPLDEIICLSVLDVLENTGMKIISKKGQTQITFCNKFKIHEL